MNHYYLVLMLGNKSIRVLQINNVENNDSKSHKLVLNG